MVPIPTMEPGYKCPTCGLRKLAKVILGPRDQRAYNVRVVDRRWLVMDEAPIPLSDYQS